MNTRISYMYRDAGNNKVFGDAVIHGTFTESQVEWMTSLLTRFPENGFIPSEIGLLGLREDFVAGSSYDPGLDHDWHEWEGVEHTDKTPTVSLSAKELLERFAQIEKKGWDPLSYIFD